MQIELYKPHPKQLEIHQALESPVLKYITVSIGRQFGKTMLGMNQGIKWAVNDGYKVAWVSPTYKQAKKVFKEVVRAVEFAPFCKNVDRSDLIIDFVSGGSIGSIVFYSAAAYDTIRGETFDALIGDEVAFWLKEAWDEALRATVAVRGKKVLFLSTPNGKNHFFDKFNQGMLSDKWQSFYGTSYDNPFIQVDDIEDAKRTLPDHIYRQEYLAEFLDGGGSVFGNIDAHVKQASDKGQLYFGVDLGRVDDYTVLTILNEDNEEVFCDRWRGEKWESLSSRVAGVINSCNAVGYVESNGAQDAIYDMIKDKVVDGEDRVHSFVTTTKSKPIIVEDMIADWQGENATIVGKEWQKLELSAFGYLYNPKTKKIKYEGMGGVHDDYVMSRCIANHARKKLKNTGEIWVY